MEEQTNAPIPFAPGQPVVLNRQVELDVTLEQLWSLVSEPANLQGWLADDIDLDMSPGSVGTIVDDGVVHNVRVDRVDPGCRLEFTWSPVDEPSHVSVVVMELEALPSGASRLGISETLLGRVGQGRVGRGGVVAGYTGLTAPEPTSASRWDIRVLSLWACTVAMALVQ